MSRVGRYVGRDTGGSQLANPTGSLRSGMAKVIRQRQYFVYKEQALCLCYPNSISQTSNIQIVSAYYNSSNTRMMDEALDQVDCCTLLVTFTNA
jgi:hypothetical protein